MKDFQEQLQEYRLRKRRKEVLRGLKSKITKFFMLGVGEQKQETTINILKSDTISDKEQCDSQSENGFVESDEFMEDEQGIVDNEVQNQSKWFKYTLWTVYFLFWVTSFIIFIELGFGMVFLLFSALFGIYFNTRTGPKKRSEISAYSVFNKNCESIDGTLKAEQFEREIGYGSKNVR